MSDETVRVPAADILALAEKWQAKAESLRAYMAEHGNADGKDRTRRIVATMALGAANELRDHIATLVDAAERPDEACEMCAVAHPANDCAEVDCWHNCDADRRAPADPVGEPRKPWVAPRGGGYSAPNTQNHPPRPGQSLSGEPVPPKGPGAVSTSTPAPLSSPRRTRDEGITLTNEERADLTAELADYTMDVRVDPNTVARIALGPVIAANIVEVVLRFRAARLAGEDDR